MSKKLGIEKKSIHAKAFDESISHPHVPGRAYNITDPSLKLVTMIGGGFFNEPRYYDPNRSILDFMVELSTTGKISSTIKDEMGLTAQAKEVMEAAQAVANSSHPEDLLIIAAWARDAQGGLKLRTTPQIMLCIAANNKNTKPFVAKYGPKIMQRADEIRQVFAAWRHLYCKKNSHGQYQGGLPHCLKKPGSG